MKNPISILLLALAICLVQSFSTSQEAAARGGGGHGGGGSHGGGNHSGHGSGHAGGGNGGHAGYGGISHFHGHGHLHFRRSWYSGGGWYNGYFDEYGNQLNENDLERLYNAERPAATSTLYDNGATEATVVHNYSNGVETSSITIKTGNR